ncbi:MAG TPA: cell wall hydrolase [Steroidobacteraceae bacterium]
MITSLLHEARFRTALLRHRLVWFWQVEARETLPFLAMLGVPMLFVGGIVCFACLNQANQATQARIEQDRTQIVAREAKRTQRRESDLQCLAENIYFESRGEPVNGQYAVAEVTLNRTRAPNFPHTICGVVHEMRWDPSRKRYVADFSWTELGAMSPDDDPAWKRAVAVATAAYDETRDPIVPDALFYHATSVRPGWAKTRTAITTIGNHVFYK